LKVARDERSGGGVPSLHPFITRRPERFGAIVFNPFLNHEEELDPIDAFATGLFNGKHDLFRIQQAMERRYGLRPSHSERRLADLLRRLTECLAVIVKPAEAAQTAERVVPPDTPVFPGDGPFYCSPKAVVWDVTYACNLNCPHCLTSSGEKKDELDTREAMQLIDELSRHKVLYLSLSGGEPFLRPDILDLLGYISTTNMRVDIASNGYVLPEKIIVGIRDLPVFQVQVSIDGIGPAHDRFRGKSGAFERASRSVRRLREEGIAVSISTTATAENIDDLDRIIDFALERDCLGYKAIPFLCAGRGKQNADRLKLDRRGYHKLCQTLQRRRKELDGKMNISTEATYHFLLDPPPRSAPIDGPMGCSASYDTLSVGANGAAYPCPFLRDFPLGNLLDVELKGIWYGAPTLRALRRIAKSDLEEPCRSCKYAPIQCRGGCRAAAYLEHGSLYAHDPACFSI